MIEVRVCSIFDRTACIILAYTILLICQLTAGTKPDNSFMLEFKQLQHKQLEVEVMFSCVHKERGICPLIASDQIWKMMAEEVQRSKVVECLMTSCTTIG